MCVPAWRLRFLKNMPQKVEKNTKTDAIFFLLP